MTRAHIQARTLTDPGEMRQAVYAEGLRTGAEGVSNTARRTPLPRAVVRLAINPPRDNLQRRQNPRLSRRDNRNPPRSPP